MIDTRRKKCPCNKPLQIILEASGETVNISYTNCYPLGRLQEYPQDVFDFTKRNWSVGCHFCNRRNRVMSFKP